MRFALALLLATATAHAAPCADAPPVRPPTPDASDRLPPQPPSVSGMTATADSEWRTLHVKLESSSDTRAVALLVTSNNTAVETLVPPGGWWFEQGAGCPGAAFDVGDRVCVAARAVDAAGNRSTPSPTTCMLVVRARGSSGPRNSTDASVFVPIVLMWIGVGVLAAVLLRFRARRIAARPELGDTNLPPARVHEPD